MSRRANSVPLPSSSRNAPIAISSSAKPLPIAIPSTRLAATVLRDAYTSARATMAQLVTINGRNMPSERSSAGSHALKTSSTDVTRLAMISTYTGTRICCSNQRRVAEISTFEQASTHSVATPSPRPLTNDDVTASSGQMPRSWTSPGFSCHRPLTSRARSVASLTIRPAAGLAGSRIRAPRSPRSIATYPGPH